VNLKNKIAFIFATLLLLSLAACSTSATPTSEQPTETAIATVVPASTDALSDPSSNASTEAATPQATQETIVLEGAETTASGLQFLDVTPGDGVARRRRYLTLISLPAARWTEFANTAQEKRQTNHHRLFANQICPAWMKGWPDESWRHCKNGPCLRACLAQGLRHGPRQ
jgi:hypothetical protein